MIVKGSGDYLFYSLMVLGPIVSVSSPEWFMCWVGVELSFIGVIPLLMDKNKSLSKESSLKYFCVQALGSGVLMFGAIMKFYMPLFTCSDYIFLVGIILKLGAFPLHFWVPSVMGGLDLAPLFLILTWQKLAPFLFLLNLLENSPELQVPMLIIGGLSAPIGAAIGLNQTKISPMLGASSISHTGWTMIAAVSGCFWLYFSLYVVSIFCLLLLLIKRDTLLSSLMVLSLSGLPPFILFVGKWSVMKMALLSWPVWVVVFPLLGSFMSLYFYLKFFFSMFLGQRISTQELNYLCGLMFVTVSGTLILISVVY